ncbi:outer membrane beta-barrel protein [Stappia sp. 28M-7]|uniref:outer membrane beta-barrel protein n=1 Tax=Stappia sp. 28M-7 TaxID=2762596 RepID=UPI00163C7FDB|nr:outer membrane beta-barrel protein [Stappia sp. 28M-7]MBC2861148.1 outer membrane beta-barrel protein [Stappia sp. 28M-7]
MTRTALSALAVMALLAAQLPTAARVQAQDTGLGSGSASGSGSLFGSAPLASSADTGFDGEAEDGVDPLGREDGVSAQGRSGTRGTISEIGPGAGEEAQALTATGRAEPVQPFSERLRAVQRRSALGGGGRIANTAYAGDTTRDEPRGMRVGSFLLYPELFTGLGWSDNRAGDSNGNGGATYRIAPSLRVQSDWSRHSLGINFRGSYTGYPDSGLEADPNVSSDALLRLEVGERTEVDISGSYGLSMQDRGTAESAGGDQEIHSLGGGLALRRDLGLVGAELRGEVDATYYQGAGGAAANRDRDNALFTATLRVDGNTGAAVTPFAEASVLARRYMDACNNPALCEDRNSSGYGLRAGLAFDNGGKISGDIAVGWRSERLDDARLARLEGMTVDGSLVWSPTRLTTVTALASTSFAPSSLAGTPGSAAYSSDLRVAHGFSDALSGEVGIGYTWRDYTGLVLTEQEARATTALTWALTSNVALQGRYTFRRFISSNPGSSYDSNTIEAGLRFRH